MECYQFDPFFKSQELVILFSFALIINFVNGVIVVLSGFRMIFVLSLFTCRARRMRINLNTNIIIREKMFKGSVQGRPANYGLENVIGANCCIPRNL